MIHWDQGDVVAYALPEQICKNDGNSSGTLYEHVKNHFFVEPLLGLPTREIRRVATSEL